MLQDTLIGARADKVTTLAQSFNAALAANKLLQPADGSAKSYLLALIDTDAGNPAVASAAPGTRQSPTCASCAARWRAATLPRRMPGCWKRARFRSAARTSMRQRASCRRARERGAQRSSVVGANSLARIEYVAPKFPAATRNRNMSGWVELEFTVRADGTTGDIVVTNSSPRKTFDAAAVSAVGAVALQAGDARRQAGRPARRRPHPLHGRIDGAATHKTLPDRRRRRQVRVSGCSTRWPSGWPADTIVHHGLDLLRPRAHRHDGARLRHRDARAGIRRRHRGADHRQLRLDPQAAQPARLSRR